jgi:hypothetical protein
MEEVRAYQLHLVEHKYSWAHINQAACTPRVFCDIKETFERIVSSKEPEKLPPLLNHEKTARFFAAVGNPIAKRAAPPSRCLSPRFLPLLCGRWPGAWGDVRDGAASEKFAPRPDLTLR